MAQLIVRNLDEEIVHQLKHRAVLHNRSMEAEHREILRHALVESNKKISFKELLLSIPEVGEDADFQRIDGNIRDRDL